MNNDTNPAGWEERYNQMWLPLEEQGFEIFFKRDIKYNKEIFKDFIREEIAAAKQEQWGIDHQEMAQEVDMAFKAGQRDLLEKVKERIKERLSVCLEGLPVSDPMMYGNTRFMTSDVVERITETSTLLLSSLEDLSKEL